MALYRKWLLMPRLRPLVRSRRFTQDAGAKVRVRFAPSPTGQLHVGGLRTALYNYFYAKSRGGTFVLRIEDTDQTRAVEGAEKRLMDVLQWAGIHVDEGPAQGGEYGPYVQSQRLAFYEEKIKELLENGSAYPCFCSEKRLKLMRINMRQRGEIPQYDNRCRSLTKDEVAKNMAKGLPYAIRLKLMPYKDAWHDIVYGPITHDVAASECDPILMKTDGYPTYHFANVVDDHLMRITHVLRGEEWQTSTTKHLLLYKAFGWTPPQYAHIPVLLNEHGKKLSKRQNDMHVEHLKNEGYSAEILINWLCHMSSGFTRDRVDMHDLTMNELIQCFDINRINTHSSRLDFEVLRRMRQDDYIKQLQHDKAGLINRAREVIERHFGADVDVSVSDEHLENILNQTVVSRRLESLKDLVSDEYRFLWQSDLGLTENDFHSVNANASHLIETLIEALTIIEGDDLTGINKHLKQIAKEKEYKFADIMKVARLALFGKLQGPSFKELLEMLGKESAIQRLHKALQLVNVECKEEV